MRLWLSYFNFIHINPLFTTVHQTIEWENFGNGPFSSPGGTVIPSWLGLQTLVCETGTQRKGEDVIKAGKA